MKQSTKITTICVLFSIVVLGSCEKDSLPSAGNGDDAESYEITGQVFAIQQNRVNVKLGGVEVYHINAASIDAKLEWVALNLNKAKALREYTDKLKRIVDTARNERPSNLEFTQQELFKSMLSLIDEALERVADSSLLADLDELNQVSLESESQFGAPDYFNDYSWMITAIFSGWLDKQKFAVTTTNADGNFSFSLPDRSKGYLVASCSRSVFESKTEYYYWIYEVTGEITTPIHLTTSNTLNTQQIGILLDSFRTEKAYSTVDLIEEYDLFKLDWIDEIQSGLTKVSTIRNQISLNKDEIINLKSKIEEIQYLSEP